MTVYGKFGRNPDEGPIDKAMIMRAARELRVHGEQLRQQKREADSRYQYAIGESYYVLLQSICDDPPEWTGKLIEGFTRDGLSPMARGPTRELALQRMHWQYALELHNKLRLPWDEARKRAAHTVFLDAGG